MALCTVYDYKITVLCIFRIVVSLMLKIPYTECVLHISTLNRRSRVAIRDSTKKKSKSQREKVQKGIGPIRIWRDIIPLYLSNLPTLENLPF